MTTIRHGRESDLEAIVSIYNHYIRETAITFDIEEFTTEARRPWFGVFAETGRHQLFVAEENGAIAGYAGSHPFRPKAAYETSVETTIYLDPAYTGQGLGTRLYERLFASIAGEDVHRALAGITEGNPASIKLHEQFGFVKTGFFSEVGRKFDRYWGVDWLEKTL